MSSRDVGPFIHLVEIHDPVRPTVSSKSVFPISALSHLGVPFDNGVYLRGNLILHSVHDKLPD